MSSGSDKQTKYKVQYLVYRLKTKADSSVSTSSINQTIKTLLKNKSILIFSQKQRKYFQNLNFTDTYIYFIQGKDLHYFLKVKRQQYQKINELIQRYETDDEQLTQISQQNKFNPYSQSLKMGNNSLLQTLKKNLKNEKKFPQYCIQIQIILQLVKTSKKSLDSQFKFIFDQSQKNIQKVKEFYGHKLRDIISYPQSSNKKINSESKDYILSKKQQTQSEQSKSSSSQSDSSDNGSSSQSESSNSSSQSQVSKQDRKRKKSKSQALKDKKQKKTKEKHKHQKRSKEDRGKQKQKGKQKKQKDRSENKEKQRDKKRKHSKQRRQESKDFRKKQNRSRSRSKIKQKEANRKSQKYQNKKDQRKSDKNKENKQIIQIVAKRSRSKSKDKNSKNKVQKDRRSREKSSSQRGSKDRSTKQKFSKLSEQRGNNHEKQMKRVEKVERVEKAEKAEKAEKTEKTEKAEKMEKMENSQSINPIKADQEVKRKLQQQISQQIQQKNQINIGNIKIQEKEQNDIKKQPTKQQDNFAFQSILNKKKIPIQQRFVNANKKNE